MRQGAVRTAVMTALITTAVVASTAGAADASGDGRPQSYTNVANFCEDVQNELANVRRNAIDFNALQYDEDDTASPTSGFGYRAFRSSYNKEVDANDLSVHQMNIDNPDGSVSQVMCKTKLRERLITYPGLHKAFKGEEAACQDVARTIVKRAKSGSGRNRARVVVDPTEYDEFGGIGWTPLGYQTIVTDAAGTVHVRSHGLLTPSDPMTQISDAFVDLINASFGLTLPYGTTYQDIINMGALSSKVLGTHYCTLPTVAAVRQAMGL